MKTAKDICFEGLAEAGRMMKEEGRSKEEAENRAMHLTTLRHFGVHLPGCPDDIYGRYVEELKRKNKERYKK